MAFRLLKEYQGMLHWWRSKQELILVQIWVVLILSHMVYALRERIAMAVDCDPFEVSVPLLVELLPRLCSTLTLQLEQLVQSGRQMGLLREPTEMASVLVFAPTGTSLEERVEALGARWTVEQCFEEAKGDVGLDEYDLYRRSPTAFLLFCRQTISSFCASLGLVILATHATSPREALPLQTQKPYHWSSTTVGLSRSRASGYPMQRQRRQASKPKPPGLLSRQQGAPDLLLI